MKTFLSKYLKIGSLVLVTGLSFLFSAGTFNDDDPDPCFPEGTRAWDGYQCFCNVGYKGKCCEINMDTDQAMVGCNFPDDFEFKMTPLACSMRVDGGAELEAVLIKIVTITAKGAGWFEVAFDGIAYKCEKGRMMKDCMTKDCSAALKELLGFTK
ncbi:MAG: hypothetical protein ACLTSL_14435 [Odoribacter splanchnicus]